MVLVGRTLRYVTSDEVRDWTAGVVPTSLEIFQAESSTDQSTWTQLIQVDWLWISSCEASGGRDDGLVHEDSIQAVLWDEVQSTLMVDRSMQGSWTTWCTYTVDQ